MSSLSDGKHLEDYLSKAQSIAHAVKYPPTAVFDYDDFTGAAYLALCEAALTYDETKGMTFKSYLNMVIRFGVIHAYREQFGNRQREDVVVPFLTWEYDLKVQYHNSYEYVRDIRRQVQEAVNGLTEKQRAIIIGIYWLGKSERGLAREQGLASKNAIGAMHRGALKRLRKALEYTRS